MDLILLRHGQSLRKKIGIWGRNFDAPLDPEYLYQLNGSKNELQFYSNISIYSSPLRRCIDSVKYMFGHEININIIDSFRAYNSGFFEDKTEEFINTNFPDYLTMSFKDKFTVPKFDEESIYSQTIRVKEGIKYVLDRGADNSLLIVTHFSVINIIANIVENNFEISTYADGRYEVKEGGFINFKINPNKILNSL